MMLAFEFVFKEGVDLLIAVVPPLGNVVLEKTVSRRMDAAENNLRLVHKEISDSNISKHTQ